MGRRRRTAGTSRGPRAATRAGSAFSKSASKAVEGFFEELVVRRGSRGVLRAWYRPKYDQLEGQKYDWAKDTSRADASDPRDHVYSLEQFEQAKTHDKLWNAAQLELVHGGKMPPHAHVLGKKIRSARVAIAGAGARACVTATARALDGRDDEP